MRVENPILIVITGLIICTVTASIAQAGLYEALSEFTAAEKENAEIELSSDATLSPDIESQIRRCEHLWNEGHFKQALLVMEQWASDAAAPPINVTITWREPVITGRADRWVTDVRIGTADDVLAMDLTVHEPSGNMLISIIHQAAALQWWRSYISYNGGLTWDEIYTFGITEIGFDVSATVRSGAFCVAHTRQSGTFLYFFSVYTGAHLQTPSGWSYVTLHSYGFERFKMGSSAADASPLSLCWAGVRSNGEIRFGFTIDGDVEWEYAGRRHIRL